MAQPSSPNACTGTCSCCCRVIYITYGNPADTWTNTAIAPELVEEAARRIVQQYDQQCAEKEYIPEPREPVPRGPRPTLRPTDHPEPRRACESYRVNRARPPPGVWPAPAGVEYAITPIARERIMRAGDTVKHKPSGETWTVAYVDGEYLAWCGWPEGEARVADCELVEACSDEEHRRVLEDWAAIYRRGNTDGWDRRPARCFAALCELNQAFVGMGL